MPDKQDPTPREIAASVTAAVGTLNETLQKAAQAGLRVDVETLPMQSFQIGSFTQVSVEILQRLGD